MLWRAVLYSVGCLEAYLLPTHQMPETLSHLGKLKMSPDIAKCPIESKNHPQLRATALGEVSHHDLWTFMQPASHVSCLEVEAPEYLTHRTPVN